jgi:uncharacterized membrane protein (DUF106 family)
MAEAKSTPSASGSSGQLIMIMMLFLTLFIMFDPNLRDAVGNIAGYVLGPIIGFDSQYPVLTVMMAGLLMVTFSTGLRHYFIDWVTMAEKQQKMKDFNKQLRKARMEGNTAEVNKLMKKNLEMTKDTMSTTMDQMKPMMFTMIFLIATFAYIGSFIIDIPGATLSVPWSSNVNMNDSVVCMFSNWIFVYFLISISMAQVVQRSLKWYSFKKRLETIDEEPLVREEEETAEEAEFEDGFIKDEEEDGEDDLIEENDQGEEV